MPLPYNQFGGYTQQQADEDKAFRDSPLGQILQSLGPSSPELQALVNGRNPNAFARGINAKTAYESRKIGKRIFAPAMGALTAQNALLPGTLDLAGRTAAGYGAIYRAEAEKARQSYDQQNPDMAALLKLLTQDATQLVAGHGNDPYEDRLVEQGVRGSLAARGLGWSPSAALQENLAIDRAREGRRMGRGSYAAGILNQGQNYYADALRALFSMGGIQAPDVGSGTGDLSSIGINDIMQRRNLKAARRAGNQQLIGTGIQALTSIAGAAAACWVAEVLYGKDDARTHLARAWVASHDTLFLRAYRKHGQAWARWLEVNRWARPWVQPIWDAMWWAQAEIIADSQ